MTVSSISRVVFIWKTIRSSDLIVNRMFQASRRFFVLQPLRLDDHLSLHDVKATERPNLSDRQVEELYDADRLDGPVRRFERLEPDTADIAQRRLPERLVPVARFRILDLAALVHEDPEVDLESGPRVAVREDEGAGLGVDPVE